MHENPRACIIIVWIDLNVREEKEWIETEAREPSGMHSTCFGTIYVPVKFNLGSSKIEEDGMNQSEEKKIVSKYEISLTLAQLEHLGGARQIIKV